MTLGERVAVLRDGVLQQVDTPQKLYRHPANLFVAAFIGSPPMNLVEAKVRSGRLLFGGWDLPSGEGVDLSALRGQERDPRRASLGHGGREGLARRVAPTIEVIAEVTGGARVGGATSCSRWTSRR